MLKSLLYSEKTFGKSLFNNFIHNTEEQTMIHLEHNFKTKAHSLPRLFEGVTKMSQLMKKIETESQIDPLRYDPDKYKGDAFEFFVELFLALHPTDNRVGVYNYKPYQINDNGVDGIGQNIKNEKCIVQIKYRSNKEYELTANNDHLSNFVANGMIAHGIIDDKENHKNFRHFIFTTASGLHFYTDKEMYEEKVKCFGINDFKSMLDNNIVFWDKVREIVATL
jgi:hypothetical protein